MKNSKIFLKRAAYVLAGILILSSSIAHYAFAEKAESGVTMGNVREKIMEEGKARVVANVLYKCFKLNYNYVGDGLNSAHEGDDIYDVNKIFYGYVANVGLDGGAWYEKQQEGSVDDGYISCDEKGGSDALKLFAKYITDGNVDIILCGENHTPGTFNNVGQSGKCEGLKDGDITFQRNSNWESYLKGLYEAKASSAGWYDGSWSNIGNYDEYVGYGMYLQEIEAGCGSETTGSNHSTNKLQYLDDTGAYVEKYISGDDSSYPVPNTNHSGNRYSFASWGINKTCNEIIGRASELAPQVQTKLFELIEEGCKTAYTQQKDAAQEVLNDASASDSKKEEAQKKVDEFNSLTEYSQDVTNSQGNVGKECIDVEFLLKPIQDDYDPTADTGTDTENEANCYTKAGSLGWILCPIISSLGDFILDQYEKWVVPALQMEPQLFSSESGTYTAWAIFRDIANVLFVILFLVVIFSQLTGFGIDNYGIKKVLPKLILGAILINLSYIICQLTIDVFNLVGHGIGGLFQSISSQLDSQITSLNLDNQNVPSTAWESYTSSGWNTVLVIVVAAAGVAAVLSQGLAIIIPVLLLMISVAFSLFSLIVILGIRQAAAVLLVALSPIAFVCYMLPNTKSVFNKWFNAFKGVLIAFPICSALIYGGDLAGKILITAAGSSQNTMVAISAAIVSIAPIFFIPKAIVGSMGMIGGAIMRMQGGMSRRLGGRVAHSNAANSLQMNHQRKVMRRQSGLKFDKDGNIVGVSARGKMQDRLALTKGQKERLGMRRMQAGRAAMQEGNLAMYAGQAGADKLMLQQRSAEASRRDQDVRDLQASIGLGDATAYKFDDSGAPVAIRDSNGNITGYETTKVNPASIDSLQQGLRSALVSGNVDGIKAYQNMLAGRGDKGREAIMNAMVEAQGSPNGVTGASVQAYSQNIMDNYSKDFKDNARSIYNYAAANQGINATDEKFSGAGMGDAAYMTKGTSLKGTQIGGMDDFELAAIANNISNGSMESAEAAAAQSAAAAALSDPTIRGGIKEGNIQKLIQINGGVDPVAQKAQAEREANIAAQSAQQAQADTLREINNQLKGMQPKKNEPPKLILPK